MRKSILTLALAAAAPTIVAAQSMPPGFYINGDLTMERYYFNGGDHSDYGVYDVSLGFRTNPGSGSAGSFASGPSMADFGFQVDFLGLHSYEYDDDENVILPWMYYQSPVGRISLGYTPPVTRDYVDRTEIFPGRAYQSSEGGIINRSYLDVARRFEGGEMPSIRYDHMIGALEFGASYTRLGDGADYDVVAVGASYEQGNLRLGAAYEEVLDENVSYLGLSARYTMGRAAIIGNFTDTSFIGDLKSYSLGVEYNFNDKLMLGGSVSRLDFSGGSSDADVQAIYGRYDVWNGIYLTAGYSTVESNDITFVGLGYKFDFGS